MTPPRKLTSLLALLFVGCAAGALPLAGGGQELILVSNQENTAFRGRRIGGPADAELSGVQSPGATPDADGFVPLGSGKFVEIRAHPKGVYEIAAKPPNHRERTMTIAPPLSSRLSFVFEISDRLDRIETARPPETRVQVSVVRPEVEIASPSGTDVDSELVTVVINARSGSRIDAVTITVNGDPIPTPTELERTRGPEFSTTQKVRLVPGQNLLHVAVKDDQGRVGYDSLEIVRRQPSAPPPGAGRASLEPRYGHRLGAVIGIDRYRHWPALEGATGDARRMAAKLREMGFDQVLELYDEQATRSGILGLLGQKLARMAGPEDLAVIYFAGHGQTETLPGGEKRGYIIPVDGTIEGVFSTAISMETLKDLSNRMSAKHVYYAMDSCYSGLGLTRGLVAVPKSYGYVDKITALPAVQMITAGMEGEEAIERGGQGLFTTYLLRALDGEADVDGDGVVTAGEIGNFVRPGVTAASQQRQTPLYGTLDGSGEVVFFLR